MNILFLLKTLGVGGVEVVTITLANKFASEGHNVVIYARTSREKILKDRLHENVKYYVGFGDNDCSQNVSQLHDIYVKENIEVVVNQWGLPYKPIRLARKAEMGHRVKVISFHHNDPSTNGKLKSAEKSLKVSRNAIEKCIEQIKCSIVKKVTSASMKYTYKHSDKFMVLSESYLNHLGKFIGVPLEPKMGVLKNPITIDNTGFLFDGKNKKKEVVFCGRLDNEQKCVYRVLDVWKILQRDCKDWILRLIGDGPDREALQEKCVRENIENVFFEGYQNPLQYYQRASILMMTSDFEGFPLVLAECMAFGVVPCVFDSFAAVHDILSNGKNGLIVEPDASGSFSSVKMAENIKTIMVDERMLHSMARAAIETSSLYSIDSIYKCWVAIIKDLLAEKIK